VEPRFTSLNGYDPITYILSANINRRNLNAGQRAMAIVRLADFSEISQRQLASQTGISHSRIAYAGQRAMAVVCMNSFVTNEFGAKQRWLLHVSTRANRKSSGTNSGSR